MTYELVDNLSYRAFSILLKNTLLVVAETSRLVINDQTKLDSVSWNTFSEYVEQFSPELYANIINHFSKYIQLNGLEMLYIIILQLDLLLFSIRMGILFWRILNFLSNFWLFSSHTLLWLFANSHIYSYNSLTSSTIIEWNRQNYFFLHCAVQTGTYILDSQIF